MVSSEDEFGDTLDWDDAALQELASLDASGLPSATARGASVPLPRASQVPAKRPPPTRPAPAPVSTQRRRPPPGPSQLAFPGTGTQHAYAQQYLGPARANILRPARPPQRPAAAVTPAPPPPGSASAPAPPLAPKRFPRQSLNEHGRPGTVDPNPFAHRRARPSAASPEPDKSAEPKRECEPEPEPDDEENLPAISVDEHGGGYRAEPQRGVTVVHSQPGGGAAPRKAALAPASTREAEAQTGAGRGYSVAPAPVGQEDVLQEAEKRELRALRAEKAKLAQQLAIARKAQEQLEREVMTKTGENSVVRLRLSKAEAAHALAIKTEQRDRAILQEQLEAKDREYRATLERMKMEEVFRRQELATAGGPGSASSQRHYHHPAHPGLSSARSQRFYGRAGSAAPASPSVDRAGAAAGGARRRGASEAPTTSAVRAPPPPPPTFGGFQSAFGPPTSTVVADEAPREREGSMGPPRKRAAGQRDAPRTPGAVPEAKRQKGEGDAGGKGKARLMLVEEEDGPVDGGVAGQHGDVADDQRVGEEDGADAWAWVLEERDVRSELLAAVFTHTILTPLDVEPAVLPHIAYSLPHHHRSTIPAATLGNASNARLSTARYGAAASTFAARSTAAAPAPTRPTRSGPVPTFHALMNLHFPPSTPPALVAEYESITRELFTLLGRRLDPHGLAPAAHLSLLPTYLALSASPDELETVLLAVGLARALAALLAVLEAATLAGPMTALLRLMAHLAFLFPPFAHACTAATADRPGAGAGSDAGVGVGVGVRSDGGAEPLLVLLARILARFARPEPPQRDPSAAALLARSGAGPAQARTALRSRKAR
ncbi:hypothetical protein JCM3770_006637, partial [Rhodotorula araucariae]